MLMLPVALVVAVVLSALMPLVTVSCWPTIGVPVPSVRRAVRVAAAPGAGTLGVTATVICEPAIWSVVCFTMPLIEVVIVTWRSDLSLPGEIVPVKTPDALVVVPFGVKNVFAFVVTCTRALGTMLLLASSATTVSVAVAVLAFDKVDLSSKVMKFATFAVCESTEEPAGTWNE